MQHLYAGSAVQVSTVSREMSLTAGCTGELHGLVRALAQRVPGTTSYGAWCHVQ